MQVQLFSNDGSEVVATVEVPDFPNNPTIVGYKGRYFTSSFQYGTPSQRYTEQSFLDVSDQ